VFGHDKSFQEQWRERLLEEQTWNPMIRTPAHKQRNPDFAAGQRVNSVEALAYKPVHGGRPDVPVKTIGDYVQAVQKAEIANPPCYMDKKFDWVGFDFDRTLAAYDGWNGPASLGQPIPLMVERLKSYLLLGKPVKIFTARVWPLIEMTPGGRTIWDPRADSLDPVRVDGAYQAVIAIIAWCQTHLGVVLPVTCIKDIHCVRIYDDIARQVIPNTGKVVV
jgi:hypothetical protein